MIYFHMQRFNFIDFMVIELRFFKKKKKMKNTWQKCEKYFLRYYAYHTSQINHFLFHGYFSHILHLDIIKSEINFKLKVKMAYIWFSMGIDHSNPYIHSTTQSYRQLTEYGDLLKNGKCIRAEIPLFN